MLLLYYGACHAYVVCRRLCLSNEVFLLCLREMFEGVVKENCLFTLVTQSLHIIMYMYTELFNLLSVLIYLFIIYDMC